MAGRDAATCWRSERIGKAVVSTVVFTGARTGASCTGISHGCVAGRDGWSGRLCCAPAACRSIVCVHSRWASAEVCIMQWRVHILLWSVQILCCVHLWLGVHANSWCHHLLLVAVAHWLQLHGLWVRYSCWCIPLSSRCVSTEVGWGSFAIEGDAVGRETGSTCDWHCNRGRRGCYYYYACNSGYVL